MEANTATGLFELQVDHESTTYLKEAARWAKFLAILGFIWCGFFVLFGLFGASIRSANLGGTPYAVGYSAGVTIGYVLLALLYFFPCLYTYNFGRKMQAALRSNDQNQLNDSLKNLKASFRFLGILAVIGLCLVALGIIFIFIGLAFR